MNRRGLLKMLAAIAAVQAAPRTFERGDVLARRRLDLPDLKDGDVVELTIDLPLTSGEVFRASMPSVVMRKRAGY